MVLPEEYDDGWEDFEDANGMFFLYFDIPPKEENLLKNVAMNVIQTASGAALAAYTWRSNIHRFWPFAFSAIGTMGLVDLCSNIRAYFQRLPRFQRKRIWSCFCLGAGTITFCKGIAAFSDALKDDDRKWISCIGLAAAGYYLAVSSVSKIGRTVFERSPLFKCSQLLFGPTLITCADYYLSSVQNHDEEWVRILPMFANVAVGNHITFFGYRRFRSNNEPRWLLFKGLELMIGGCICFINGAMLVAFAVNNDYHPLLTTFFAVLLFNGVGDIYRSLKSFERCVDMGAPVFYCIGTMISGVVVFFAAIIGFRFIPNEVMLAVYIVMSGIGLYLVNSSVLELYNLVPRRVANRYCQQILGPFLTLYTSMCTAYIVYHMGWRYFPVMGIFIPAGIYATYRGYS